MLTGFDLYNAALKTAADEHMPLLLKPRNAVLAETCGIRMRFMLKEFQVVRAHFSKRGILKVCKAFLSRICHAVVFTQFGYADSKSAPCQALFLVFSFQNCKTKWPPK